MNKDWKERLRLYVEIAVVSAVWFAIMVGVGLGFRSVAQSFFDSWAGGVLLFALAVLPYLVVSSLVWGVPLGAMGAKAERANIEKLKKQAEEIK